MIKTAIIYVLVDYCIDRIDETIQFNMLQPEIRKKLNSYLYGKELINKWEPVLDNINIYDSSLANVLATMLERQVKLLNQSYLEKTK